MKFATMKKATKKLFLYGKGIQIPFINSFPESIHFYYEKIIEDAGDAFEGSLFMCRWNDALLADELC
ncbi:MAG: hypothetical protein A2020_09895 [Lentisphaerae bacterium GWF2_45_14]|nr:MAG: hypothetical protein A2020_09895 [Lentisphaerae bacterium GWF2_45_14]